MYGSRMGTHLTIVSRGALTMDVAIRSGQEVVGVRLAAALDEPEGFAGISPGTGNRVELVALSDSGSLLPLPLLGSRHDFLLFLGAGVQAAPRINRT